MLTAEIIGNLGFDAVVKQINGKDYVSFDVAHEQRNGDRSETVWVSVLWYGNGGNLLQYLKKGAKVFVRGRLQAGIYTSQKTMQSKVSLSVLVTEIHMCQFLKDEQQGQPPQPPAPSYGQRAVDYVDGDPFIRGAKALRQSGAYAPAAQEQEDLPF